ncbi:MAG: hypothetical protein KDA89_00330 [Planctomycetaceae bacterium]|nr:hypothetical protein [Planctomycetaceae bacterium]
MFRSRSATSHPANVLAATGLGLLVFVVSAVAADPMVSELWGRNGETWSTESRLPDFSWAGYHRGAKRLPTLKPDCSVKDFGAVGDGKTDDTKAFQKAIARSAGKTILVPPGTYVISDFLTFNTTGTSLKGAGSRQSILKFPTPLNDVKPNWGATTDGSRTSNYSWSGGFVAIKGSMSEKYSADVTADAKRGARSLRVSDVNGLKVGDDFRLQMSDTSQQTLARYLYAGDPGPMENLGRRSRVSFVARIVGIDAAGKRIDFDRPLRTDVRREWKPRISSAASTVEEVGIEDLGFEFPEEPYQGHFTEVGYNAMAFNGVRHCWARNLWIHNADSGIFVRGMNVTLSGIEFDSDRPPERSRKATGHHGITLSGQDNLLNGFEFRTRFMHDITVTHGSAGNVAADGSGIDLCFDHHRYANHANLFTDIDLGEGTRMFQSGGGSALGRHAGAWETFWNIRSRQPQTWPEGWGPDLMNMVGLSSSADAVTDRNGRWFEPLKNRQLTPANLHQAQLAKRMKTGP